jgi:hypothetical protein
MSDGAATAALPAGLGFGLPGAPHPYFTGFTSCGAGSIISGNTLKWKGRFGSSTHTPASDNTLNCSSSHLSDPR